MSTISKTTYMESAAPPCQVDELMFAIRAIKRHPSGYNGIHLHFSLLDRQHKQPYHRRTIATAFNKLVQNKNGQIFWTHNFDVVFICQDCSSAELDMAVITAMRAVEDSAVIKEYIEASRDDDLCDWYDLAKDMEKFMVMVAELKENSERFKVAPDPEENLKDKPTTNLKTMVNSLEKTYDNVADKPIEKNTLAQPLYEIKPKKNPLAPMGPMQLDQLERNLLNMEIFQMLASQTAYVIVGGSRPQPIFVEHFISIADIKEKLLPNYNLHADKWLFQRFTRSLDKKLMEALPKWDSMQGKVVSININIETVLTPAFDEFLPRFKRKNNQPLVVEMRLFDVMSDIEKFFQARDKLTKAGCRISLDTMDVHSLAILNRDLLAVDFLKISWKSGYKNIIGTDFEKKIKTAIKTLGEMRIILCHCDAEDALKFGESVGIHMYQGFLIDKKYGKA